MRDTARRLGFRAVLVGQPGGGEGGEDRDAGARELSVIGFDDISPAAGSPSA